MANVSQVSIPKALQGVVAGFFGLNNFRFKSAMLKPKARPAYTDPLGNTNLNPGDIASIYDLTPLYRAGIDGTGQKIAIIGQTDLYMSDIEQFRAGFGLPRNDPSDVLATNCVDPGYTADESEADLDLEWSGAVAPNSTSPPVTGRHALWDNQRDHNRHGRTTLASGNNSANRAIAQTRAGQPHPPLEPMLFADAGGNAR